jgi:hypothetical protein
LANEFKKAFKGIDQAIKQGTARALNRALATTKTRTVRALREGTGLSTDVVKTRTRAKKAKGADLSVILGIAVKFQIALSKFSPKEKTVRVKPKGKRGKATPYVGVTAKVGTQGRQLVPGGFLLQGSTIKAVIARKGAFDSSGNYIPGSSAPRYPLVELKSNVFTEVAKQQELPMKKVLMDTFDSIVSHEIDYAMQSKFDGNR